MAPIGPRRTISTHTPTVHTVHTTGMGRPSTSDIYTTRCKTSAANPSRLRSGLTRLTSRKPKSKSPTSRKDARKRRSLLCVVSLQCLRALALPASALLVDPELMQEKPFRLLSRQSSYMKSKAIHHQQIRLAHRALKSLLSSRKSCRLQARMWRWETT